MNSAPACSSPRRTWSDWIVIAIFLLLLWAPMADKFFHFDRARTAGENRLPAPRPQLRELRAGQVPKFLAASEAYFNDHFGFRSQLIGWFQSWKLAVYHDRGVNQVVTGRDHWLFIAEEQMVEHYLGLLKLPPQKLQAWQSLLEQRRDWLAARGIKYLFVIPPDKQTIYPEELPGWLVNAAPAGRETKLDQFLKYMQAHSTVEILDLRAPLLAAKQTAPTYLQNDTHWNRFGGFVACQEVIAKLSPFMPDLPPLRLADFSWTNIPATGGDLAQMLGAEDAIEKNYFQFTPGSGLPALKIEDATNLVSRWDAHKSSRIVENPGRATKTAVVFHDSFGLAWPEFLGYSFKKMVFMADNREFNPALILENHPDIVINEMLERYFNVQYPEELMAKEPLP
jgi:hypothetical protein